MSFITFQNFASHKAAILKSKNKKLNLIFVNKKYCNILDEYSLEKCIRKYRPKIILHCAGLSKPMSIHENNISKSIDLNIIGAANVTKLCKKFNLKLIACNHSGMTYVVFSSE